MRAGIAILAVSLLLGGCAIQQPKYAWGNYEAALYDYYKAPAGIAEYQAALKTLIDAADASTPPQRVPPGIYAEYGYLLMLQRQNTEAARYFEREKATWPEAAPLMDTMIRITKNNAAGPATSSLESGDARAAADMTNSSSPSSYTTSSPTP